MMDRWMMDGQMDGQMDEEWIVGWTDGWMDDKQMMDGWEAMVD